MHIRPLLTRTVFPLIAPLCLAALSGACAKTQAVPEAVSAPQKPQDYQFRVSGTLAEAGMLVRLGRKVEVGPAANGQVHRTRLSEAEFSTLEKAWNRWKKSAFEKAESCQQWPEQSPWREPSMRIQLLQNQREVILIRSDSGTLCGPGDAAQLRVLAEALLEIGRAHYPRSFPDDCLALTDDFASISEQITSCTEDSQCTNVDPTYSEIPEGQIQYVSTKSCSPAPSLPTANRQGLRDARTTLLRLREKIATVCQPQGIPGTCTAADEEGFQNHRSPARCIEGSCSAIR